MLNNVPLKSLKFDQYTIEGYSRAAVQSYWIIPELNLGFDLGAHPWNHMGIPTWLISHCHLDHIAALPVFVARRRMMKMPPPRIILPAFSVPVVEKMLRSFERLDRGRLPCELVPIERGQEIELSRELVVKAFATTHTVPSLGFIVYERRKKLKPEYTQLTGEQIRDLRLSGVDITSEIRFPLVGYTGDTTPEGLDDNPEFYLPRILITEMTFLAPGHRKHLVHKHGHTHIDDIVARKNQFKNELVILGHVSTRYNTKEARRLFEAAFADNPGERFRLWI